MLSSVRILCSTEFKGIKIFSIQKLSTVIVLHLSLGLLLRKRDSGFFSKSHISYTKSACFTRRVAAPMASSASFTRRTAAPTKLSVLPTIKHG